MDLHTESLGQCHKSVWDNRLRMFMEAVERVLWVIHALVGFFVSRHDILLNNIGVLPHPLCFGVVGGLFWAVGGGLSSVVRG